MKVAKINHQQTAMAIFFFLGSNLFKAGTLYWLTQEKTLYTVFFCALGHMDRNIYTLRCVTQGNQAKRNNHDNNSPIYLQ